ncbi:hypothetical protein [Pimelobacter simplex]|uniref:hypothetical protein n=1 Tax=Nocardioides simplex TaxID=2045 RepID=UPI003AAD318B
MKTAHLGPLTDPGNQFARSATESWQEYDQRALKALHHHYAEEIDAVVAILRNLRFDFAALRATHQTQLRAELVGRHCLPYLMTHDTYFRGRRPNLPALAAVVAGHTLSLTQLDYHFDGADPDAKRTATAQKIDLHTAVAYAIEMVYHAGALGGLHAGHLFQEVLRPVSGFVLERMHADWESRHQLPGLDGIAHKARDYHRHHQSRLMASGYWEAMSRTAFVVQGEEFPPELAQFTTVLRKVRQLADEVEDLEEDLESGLLTLPLMLGILDEGEPLRSTIENYWEQPSDRPRHSASSIVARVRTVAVQDQLRATARTLLRDLPTPDWAGFSMASGPPLSVLLDLKIGVLETGLERFESR